MTWSKIAGTGGYLPERIMSNKELEKMLDTSDEWIRERSGIKRRHIAAENETTADMAVAASRKAIEAAGIENSDIDLIIVATSTPDKIFPGTACIVQRHLEIENSPAFDVNAACSQAFCTRWISPTVLFAQVAHVTRLSSVPRRIREFSTGRTARPASCLAMAPVQLFLALPRSPASCRHIFMPMENTKICCMCRRVFPPAMMRCAVKQLLSR